MTRSAQNGGKGAVTLEVAHEALLRRRPIDGWLAEEKEALKLRDDLLREAKEWEDGGKHADFVRRGARLEAAQDLAANPNFASALEPAGAYLAAGRKAERAGRRRAGFALVSIFALMSGVIALLLARIYEQDLNRLVFRYMHARPVSAEEARKLPKGQPFWDCVKTSADYSEHCPAMVAVPAGEFMMGSPESEKDRQEDEGPRHKVAFKAPFAVAMHDVTFDQYDACVAAGRCKHAAFDHEWGRGRRPVIDVNWRDAQDYVAWLSDMTGQTYRLLSEAEWEYAARAGRQTHWFFGDDEAKLVDCAWFTANSDGKTHPVGEKKPNAFGLYDMHGNVWQWCADTWHENYRGAPEDGSVWKGGDERRVLRGGSWYNDPLYCRSARRGGNDATNRSINVGFRVARTLFTS